MHALPFVGRAAELDRIAAVLDRLAGGGPAVVRLTGEPGIGKTRLLSELAGLAAGRGVRVRYGRATEFERGVPYGVFADALGEMPQGPDRLRLSRAVQARLAAQAPLALCLDDMHFADPASAELLAYLIRRTADTAMLIVCAYRARQAPARLLAALAECGPLAVPVVDIDLGPLTLADARALIGSRPGLPALYAESGGNPLYLEALAAAGTGDDAGARGGGPGLNGLLLADLVALPERERLVLQAAAVCGDEFTPEEVAAVHGADPGPALDRLARRDLIRPAGQGTRLRFRHPLVRHVTYERSDPVWRARAHSRAARALARRAAPSRRIAHHLTRTAGGHRPEDLAVLVEAARECVTTAPASAVAWFTAALDLMPADDPARFELRLSLARALLLDGRLTDSRALLHELLPIAPPPLRGAVVTLAARTERLRGRFAEGVALLRAEAGRAGEAAALRRELSVLRLELGDVAAAADEAAGALAEAERRGDRAGEAAARSLRALISAYRGEPDAAERHQAEAAACVDALCDGEVAADPTSLSRLAWAELYRERHADAERHLRRAVELIAPARAGILGSVLCGLCRLYTLTGRLGEAVAYGEEAEDVTATSGSRILYAMGRGFHAEALALIDLDRAARLAVRAAETAAEVPGWGTSTVTATAAEVLVAAGEPDRAARLLLGSGGGPALPRAQPGFRPRWLAALADSALARGDVPGARAAADAARAAAGGLRLRGQRAYALCAHARVLAAEGDRAGAVAAADAAHALFTEAGMRPQASRTLIVTAAARELPDAHRVLVAARTAAAECGAATLAADAEREQRRLAARAPRRTGGLTRRERQVAELAITGLTSKEIARELSLSTRTVDGHLSSIYRKLRVPTRTALAHVLSREARR